MTYDEAIRFWYGRINYETRAARPEDLKLERMRELLQRLGNPQERVKTVHVAGTKGKGSTAAMIAAIGRPAGYQIGLFTSPHLVRVEERIQVDGAMITERELAVLMTELKPVIDDLDRGPFSPVTFFEIVTAMAWMHFQRNAVDLAVMEVGLGGRFDSTNVCNPAVTVITSIGYDHMTQLGDTLEEIAFQKAGIIKPGVPCVIGPLPPGALAVVRHVAATVAAPLEMVTELYPDSFKTEINLLGEHQQTNAKLAMTVAAQLFGLGMEIPLVNAWKSLQSVSWPARIEVVQTAPTVILDCAHNVPSIEALVKTMKSRFSGAQKKTCIFAVSNDKQYELMLPLLASYFNCFVLTQYGNNPRCVPPEKLASLLPASVESHIITPALAAWQYARGAAQSEDLIAITGSVFLAGELRPEFA